MNILTSSELSVLRDDLHREIVRSAVVTTLDGGDLILNKPMTIIVTYRVDNVYDSFHGEYRLKVLNLVGIDTVTGELICYDQEDGYHFIHYINLSLEELTKLYTDVVVSKNYKIKETV